MYINTKLFLSTSYSSDVCIIIAPPAKPGLPYLFEKLNYNSLSR